MRFSILSTGDCCTAGANAQSRPHSKTQNRDQRVRIALNCTLLVARVTRLPAGQIQPIAQPVANVLGKVACETVAPACSKVRRVLQRV